MADVSDEALRWPHGHFVLHGRASCLVAMQTSAKYVFALLHFEMDIVGWLIKMT